MTAYADRPWPERSAIMDACAAAGSAFYERLPNGFRVAIGRTRLGATMAELERHGFTCSRLVTFPLGTDKPAEHLRHDSSGVPASVWLFADFINKGE
jgi:hypothetical protein